MHFCLRLNDNLGKCIIAVMKKLLAIVGPTGIGKTDLAYFLSGLINASIISADSIQIYQGLDVISGKDLPKDAEFQRFKVSNSHNSNYSFGYYKIFNGTKIYLLDVVTPSQQFSVFDFNTLFDVISNLIIQEKKLPILTGGTGFYIDSIFQNIDTISIPQNRILREKLENLDCKSLQELLQEKDAQKFGKMNNSDRGNKRRLIRAIEVVGFKPLLEVKPQYADKFETLFIGLNAPREILKSRIDARVEKRLRYGALDEARRLFEQYHNLAAQIKTASGYRQLFEYLKGNYSFDEAVVKWKRAEYLNAKKQLSWFKKNKYICWFDITSGKLENRVKKLVEDWYNEREG